MKRILIVEDDSDLCGRLCFALNGSVFIIILMFIAFSVFVVPDVALPLIIYRRSERFLDCGVGVEGRSKIGRTGLRQIKTYG